MVKFADGLIFKATNKNDEVSSMFKLIVFLCSCEHEKK